MSHEIRTPMNGIIGMAELVLSTNLDAEQREFLQMLKTSADSLMQILNDILDFERIEAGKLQIEHAEFSVRTCLEEAIIPCELTARRKGLKVVRNIEESVPETLIGDELRIKQVLINLISNAVKFTPAGEIGVTIGVSEVTETTCCLNVSVRDSGIGISRDKQACIFEAFTQADGSTTRKYGGSGLGLTISSRLVRAMGGTLSVVSEPGKGSTFNFTVKVGRPQPGATKPVAHPRFEAGSKKFMEAVDSVSA